MNVGTAAWHLITGEYPPQRGGVGDYTALLAGALAAAGAEVHVWCPGPEPGPADQTGVTVHRELGRLTGADLARAGKLLDACPGPRRLLVQWVPHSFGRRSLNVAFAWWLWRRAVHGERIELMVHEPFLAFREGSWRQDAAALVHRLMATLALRASRRVWLSIPAWESYLQPWTLGRRLPFAWLPVPANVPVVHDADRVRAVRQRYAADGSLVGHLGTYGSATTELLLPTVRALVERGVHVLLLGHGSERYAAERVVTMGSLPAGELSVHLQACDVLLQPFVDGVSGRRTSAMAGLAHGIPLVTTSGRLSEPLWADSGAVRLARDVPGLVQAVADLLADAPSRARLGAAGAALYQQHFAVEHTVRALQDSDK